MTRDRRLAIARGSRGDQQRPRLTIDVEVPQMRADQMEGLRLTRRPAFFLPFAPRISPVR
jgi:hypothetical protein